MLAAVEEALPADIAIFAAAVADWRVGRRAARRRSRRTAGALPALVAHREPRHPGHHRAVATAGRPSWSSALRPRPRTWSRTPQAKLARKGCDLDRRQRRFAGSAASWAATATPSIWSPPTDVEHLADPVEGRGRASACVAHLARLIASAARDRTDGLRVQRLPMRDDLPLPRYETAGAAGMDLVAAIATIPLSSSPRSARWSRPASCCSSPPGFEAQVRPRSGLALKHGVTVLNAPGTDRRRLSRRGEGDPDQSRRRSRSRSRAACASPSSSSRRSRRSSSSTVETVDETARAGRRLRLDRA